MSAKFITLLIISLVWSSRSSTLITGVVQIDNEPIPGCAVSDPEKQITQMTDADGKFTINITDLDSGTLLFNCYSGTCPLIIEGIPLNSPQIDLGKIPLTYKEMISVSTYEKSDSNIKGQYQEIRHYNQLLGYINRTKADTTALRKVLWSDRQIRYTFDTTRNCVIIKFKDWRR